MTDHLLVTLTLVACLVAGAAVVLAYAAVRDGARRNRYQDAVVAEHLARQAKADAARERLAAMTPEAWDDAARYYGGTDADDDLEPITARKAAAQSRSPIAKEDTAA